MAISRFDTPADYKPINTYVPLPYQELALGLQSKQKQFDDQVQKGELAKKLAESFQDLDKVAIGYDDKTNTLIEKRPEVAGTNAAFKKSVQDKLDYFANKDIAGDPTARKEYNSFLNDVKSYATTGARITEAKKKYDKIATNYAQNKALGKDLGGGTGENWFTQNEKLLKGDASNVDLSSLDQEYSPLNHIDVNDNVMKIAGAIKANAVGAGFYGKDGFTKIKTELKQLDYKSDGKGNYSVDNSDKGRIFTALHSYLYTPNNEFDNTVQRSYDNLLRTGQFGDKPPTPAQYKEAKRDEYLHRAVNTYSNIDRSSDVNIDKGLRDDAKEQALLDNPQLNTYDSGSYNTEYKSVTDNYNFDEKGEVKLPGIPPAPRVDPWGHTVSEESQRVYDTEVQKYQEMQKEGKKGLHAKIDFIYKRYGLPEDPKLTPQQKNEAIQKTEESLKNQTRTMFKSSLGVLEYIGDSELKHGDLEGKEIKVAGKNFRNIDQVTGWLKDLGSDRDNYIPKEVPNTKADIRKYITENGKTAGFGVGMGRVDDDYKGAKASFEIVTPSGFKMAISAGNELQEALAPMHEINQQIMNPLKEKTPIAITNNKSGLKGYYKLFRENGVAVMKETDKEGKKILHKETVTPQELTQYIVKQLHTTKYVNDNYNGMKDAEIKLKENKLTN